LREAHASLVVGVGNVLTHERNRERKREEVKRREREEGERERERESVACGSNARMPVCTYRLSNAVPMLRVPGPGSIVVAVGPCEREIR